LAVCIQMLSLNTVRSSIWQRKHQLFKNHLYSCWHE
jgi:hypothetical protein